MKRLAFVVVLVLVAFASCNRTHNYIIPVDYEKYYEGVTSLTEEESQELTHNISMAWYNNTIGKEIPDIKVKTIDGKEVRLKKLLKGETILIFSEPYCGWGGEEVETAFPATLCNMKDELEGIDILCLIGLFEDADLQETIDFAKSLQDKYEKIYLIEQKDAMRTNLTGSPTKFFIDKEQIVRHIQMGFALDGRSEEVIRQGVSLMRKEKQQ